MAITLDTVVAALDNLKAKVVTEGGQVAAKLQALADALAQGSTITAAQVQKLVDDINGVTAAVEAFVPDAPAPGGDPTPQP